MYFAYGWPRIYNTTNHDNGFFFLHLDHQCLVCVSSTSVQVWSGGQHHALLGKFQRDPEHIKAEGHNMAAVWSSARSTLVILTSENSLHFYSVQFSKDALVASMDVFAMKVEITLKLSITIDMEASATCMTADSRVILLGSDVGLLAAFSWDGQLEETASPLATISPGVISPMKAADMDVHITALDYCDKAKVLVLVLKDGSCAFCRSSLTGISPLHEVVFSHWVCGPSAGAICARVGAYAQMVAVGCSNGGVALYSLYRRSVSDPAFGEAGREADSPLRVLMLDGWGHRAQQIGPISQIQWAPDQRAIAVGYCHQGVAVWSPSGCRLVCSLRQTRGSLGLVGQRTTLSSMPSHGSGASGSSLEDEFEGGTSALTWGVHGYQLLVAESGPRHALVELALARTLPNHHRVSSTMEGLVASSTSEREELHVLQGHDRLLLVAEVASASEPEASARSNDLLVRHVILPQAYIATNWPLVSASVSHNGLDIAVAGRRGLALYNRTVDKWRLFGDISQERRICVHALGWLGNVVVVISGPERDLTGGEISSSADSVAGGFEMLLFPRTHLDFSSLLCRQPLSQPPLAMDCLGNCILIASEPLDIALWEVELKGPSGPSSKSVATLSLVREICLLDQGRPLLSLALVAPPLTPVANATLTRLGRSTDPGDARAASPQPPAGPGPTSSAAVAAAGVITAAALPSQCVLLRWGGFMSMLTLDRGAEVPLAMEVECFWLSAPLPPLLQPHAFPSENLPGVPDLRCPTCGNYPPCSCSGEATPTGGSSLAPNLLGGEMPWWAYGPRGMQLWFPSSLSQPLTPRAESGDGYNDIELEFDHEVYPVGISHADAAIIGITERVVHGASLSSSLSASLGLSSTPCYHLIAESQPVLPVLLRRLLQRGDSASAYALAARHQAGSHFTRSLEWLLFTALEMETSKSSARKQSGTMASPGLPNLGLGLSQLLSAAANLVRRFPQFAEVVVSVARKTDAQLWPPLFAAVGSPSLLLESQMISGALAGAACFLLILDRLEGAAAAHAHALRLLSAALNAKQYPLCGELMRFIVPPAEHSTPKASAKNQAPDGKSAVAVAKPVETGGLSNGLNAQAPEAESKDKQTWVGWLFGIPAMDNRRSRRDASSLIKSPPNSPRRDPNEVSGPDPYGRSLADQKLSDNAGCKEVTEAACTTIAGHAWGLLDSGHLADIASLAGAMANTPLALSQIMKAHVQKRAVGEWEPSAEELVAAVKCVSTELPVWSSETYETDAARLLEVCREIQATKWALALSLICVDYREIEAFRLRNKAVWAQFVAAVEGNASLGFLKDVVELATAENISGTPSEQEIELSFDNLGELRVYPISQEQSEASVRDDDFEEEFTGSCGTKSSTSYAVNEYSKNLLNLKPLKVMHPPLQAPNMGLSEVEPEIQIGTPTQSVDFRK